MQKKQIELLDTVALLEDLPQRGLECGEVGTVVEVLAPEVYEVEFSDDDGQTYAQFALRGEQIVVLHNQGEGLKLAA
jgi:membrane protein implicated in regulation of membrane protease activity